MLPLAIGVALSPIPIVAVVLTLSTPRGRPNGAAFVAGWFIGAALIGTIVLLVAGGAGASSAGKPKTWVSVLKLILASLLVLVAIRMWRRRSGEATEPQLPHWMQRIDSFTEPKSAGLGAALAGVNPKNLILTISAGAAIAQAGLSSGKQAIALAIFVVVATLGPGIPLGVYLALGDGSHRLLATLRAWMVRHNQAIMSVLCAVITAKLAGDAIGGLTS